VKAKCIAFSAVVLPLVRACTGMALGSSGNVFLARTTYCQRGRGAGRRNRRIECEAGVAGRAATDSRLEMNRASACPG